MAGAKVAIEAPLDTRRGCPDGLLPEQNGEWAVPRRYMSMESLNQMCNEDVGTALIAAAE